jgi:dCMP deaminase
MVETARIWSQQSYCKRLKVGAVLSKDGRILATGYNGTISGLENRCEDSIWKCKFCGFESANKIDRCPTCNLEHIEEILTTSDFVLHAEQNVITFSAKNGISTKGCTLYITHSPCKQCSKIIAQSGIKRVVYETEYRDRDGVEFLEKVGVEVEVAGE